MPKLIYNIAEAVAKHIEATNPTLICKKVHPSVYYCHYAITHATIYYKVRKPQLIFGGCQITFLASHCGINDHYLDYCDPDLIHKLDVLIEKSCFPSDPSKHPIPRI